MTIPFVDGNAVRLLENGTAYFPALIEAIESARHEIHLETYIFEDDEIGCAVADALAHARRRGAAVRVLVDGFGASSFYEMLGRRLVEDGCEVMIYRAEIARFRIRRHRLRRLHRKLVVVDSRIAFVGGINVIGDHTDTVPGFPRYDYAVAIEGPLVTEIHQAMRHLWRLVRWAYLHRRPDPPADFPVDRSPRGSIRAAFLIRDNLRHRRDIEDAYIAAMDAARQRVLIACAYFLPGQHFREALVAAARRGVEVTVLLQSRGDHAVIRHAERMLYRELLAAGIRIFEYQLAFLHAKVGVVDTQWATVGSSNIDPFSLLLAREANVVIDDEAFATTLRERLQAAIHEGGRRIMLEDLRRYGWWPRLLQRMAYAFVRFAVGITRYGEDDYRA